MKLLGKYNIIKGDDVTLDSGKTVESEIGKLDAAVSKLNSEVKWLYKYGGTGSKGTGGGGGGSSAPVSSDFSLDSRLNGTPFKDSELVILPESGKYELYLRAVTKTVDRLFIVQILQNNTYRNVRLTKDNGFEASVLLLLDGSGDILVTMHTTDSEKVVSSKCSYNTKPYSFEVSLLDYQNNPLKSLLFFEDYTYDKSRHINISLDFSNNVALSYVRCSLKYLGQYIEGYKDLMLDMKEPTSYKRMIELPEQFNEGEIGLRSFEYEIEVRDGINSPVFLTKEQLFTLLPSELYILVYSKTGKVYDLSSEVTPYKFNSGTNSLVFNIYEGKSPNTDRTYNVKYTIDGKTPQERSVPLRTPTTIALDITGDGIRETDEFTVHSVLVEAESAYAGSYFSKTYYVYTRKVNKDLLWYKNGNECVLNAYRINESVGNFSGITNRIVLGENSDVYTIKDIEYPTIRQHPYNLNLAFSIQYSETNAPSALILLVWDGGDLPKFVLKLDKFEWYAGTEPTACEIFFPITDDYNEGNLDNYHLVLLQQNYQTTIDDVDYYEMAIYIDGILEGVFLNLTQNVLNVTQIDLNNISACYNLVECTYIEQTRNAELIELQNYRYWLKYNDIYYRDNKINIDTSKLLMENLVGVSVDAADSADVTMTEDIIKNIAPLCPVPILLLTAVETPARLLLMEVINKSYKDTEESFLPIPVTVKWANANEELREIQIPASLGDNTMFTIENQGSSTKMNKSKNLELAITSGASLDSSGLEDIPVPIFSPNFKNGDPTTFLPEESYTLKADVVDSSHSKNTTIGKFVNDVCLKFNTGSSSKYAKHVKNCLDGFSILVFLKIVDVDGNETTHYFGVYNFNLGRKSYFNLGYRNLQALEDANLLDVSDSWCFASVSPSKAEINKQLIVAEIQNNSPYFDFSQYDSSVLFDLSTSNLNDSDYMFGDLVTGGSEAASQEKIRTFVKSVAGAGYYVFNNIGKKFGGYTRGTTDCGYYGVDENGVSNNYVPDAMTQYKRTIEDGISVHRKIEGEKPVVDISNFLDTVSTTNDGENDLDSRVNMASLYEYYTICMAFGLVDSVLKNMNIKTWNGRQFNMAFYDMDTCLGRDNLSRKTSYLCFSDYFELLYIEVDGVLTPSLPVMYRDFSKVDNNGQTYDIPSSYLFALAKYAKIFANEEITAPVPLLLWALWRSSSNSVKNEGVLKNADVFLNKYFKNNLKAIDTILINLNYRSKYLWRISTQFQESNWSQFTGSGYYSIRDWLTKRFRILDSFFNLISANIAIQTRNEDGTWSLYKGLNELTRESGTSGYSNNPDILILLDMFTSGMLVTHGATDMPMNFTVSANEASPFLMQSPTSIVRYVLNERTWNLLLGVNPSQKFQLGGSAAWTSLKSIDPAYAFLHGDSTKILVINSKYLTNIVGTGVYNYNNTEVETKFDGFNITAPSVRSISLTGKNYSGALNITYESMPNLKDIDISGSKISLKVDGSLLKSITANDIESSNVSIINCKNLENIQFDHANIGTFTVRDFNSPEVSFNGLKIKEITLSSRHESGTSISISNNSILETINVENVSALNIINCPNLKTINIVSSNPELAKKLTALSVVSCSKGSLTINSSTEGEVDLSKFTELHTLDLSKTNGYSRVITNSDITDINFSANTNNWPTYGSLTPPVFLTFKSVYIKGGSWVITHDGLFRNHSNFSTFEGDSLNKISLNTTSLRGMFQRTVINLNTLNSFLKAVKDKGLDKVTDVRNMIALCDKVSYHSSSLQSDLKNKAYSGPLFNLIENRTDISYNNCNNVTAIHPQMFANLKGKLLNIKSCCGNSTEDEIYITKDSLKTETDGTPAYSKITVIGFNNSDENTGSKTLIPVDLNGEILTNIHWNDILPQNMSKLTSLSYFNVKADFIDLTNALEGYTSWFDNYNVLGSGTKKNVKGLKGLFKPATSLRYLRNSFSNLVVNDFEEDKDYIDFYDLFNWETFLKPTSQRTNNFAPITDSVSYFNEDDVSCKAVTYTPDDENCTYYKLWKAVLDSLTSSIQLLFNLTILSKFDNLIIPYKCNKVTNINRAFSNMRLKSTIGDTDKYIKLDLHWFNNIPNASDCAYAFSNTYLDLSIPTNFLGCLNSTAYINCFYKKDDQLVPAKYYGNTYRQARHISYMFYNVNWKQESAFCTDRVEGDNIVNASGEVLYTRKRVVVDDEIFYDLYYEKETSVSPTPIVDDIYDAMKETFETPSITENMISGYPMPPLNGGMTSHFMLPADFFRGIANNSSLEAVFSSDMSNNIGGVLPKYLLNISQTVSNTYHTFSMCKVVPRKVGSYTDNGILHNVYQYLPDDFATLTNFNNTFLFAYQFWNTSFNNDEIYFISNKTFSLNLTSLKGAIQFETGRNTRYVKASSDCKITLCYSFDGEHYNPGIDKTLYPKLNFAGLISDEMAKIINGYVFTESTVLNNGIRWSTDSNPVISVMDYVSPYMMLPEAKGKFFGVINNTTPVVGSTRPNVEINKSLIVGGDSSVPYYQNMNTISDLGLKFV